MDQKKVRERKLFDAVYADRTFAEVLPHESPDFLARLAGASPLFGVEIAEYFNSETEARLHKMEGYSDRLLSGGDFRHKQDRKQLKVSNIDILNPDGSVKASSIPAIVRREPALHEVSEALASLVRRKNARLTEAFKNLDHVNLVIADRSHLIGRVKLKLFYQSFLKGELREAVSASRFREVYFLTKSGANCISIPLKLLIGIASLYLFNDAAVESYNSGGIARAKLMRMFASYLSSISAGPVGVRVEREQVEVLYGDSGLIVDENNRATIRLYNDSPWPSDCSIVSGDGAVLPEGLLQKISLMEREKAFVTELSFPVNAIHLDL